jgi:cyanophycin synthetase
MPGEGPRSLVEVRLLDGPNLYFPRPAGKVTLDCTGLVCIPADFAPQ